jgi:hypothetical protein
MKDDRGILCKVQKEDGNEEPSRGHNEKWQTCHEGYLLRLWNNGAKLPEREEIIARVK